MLRSRAFASERQNVSAGRGDTETAATGLFSCIGASLVGFVLFFFLCLLLSTAGTHSFTSPSLSLSVSHTRAVLGCPQKAEKKIAPFCSSALSASAHYTASIHEPKAKAMLVRSPVLTQTQFKPILLVRVVPFTKLRRGVEESGGEWGRRIPRAVALSCCPPCHSLPASASASSASAPPLLLGLWVSLPPNTEGPKCPSLLHRYSAHYGRSTPLSVSGQSTEYLASSSGRRHGRKVRTC